MTYQNLIISAIRDKAAQIDGDVRVDYSDHGSCSVIVEAEDASLFLILGPRGGVRHANWSTPLGRPQTLSKSETYKMYWVWDFFKTVKRQYGIIASYED